VKKALLILILNFLGMRSYAQTVITLPNPILRYETQYATSDLNLKKIDTLLDDFHRYQPIMQWEVPYLSSNLGNVPRPLLFDPILQIGYQHGYQSVQKYFLNTDSVKYYNTKTPFTSAQYIFGAKEESLVEFTHSQNIKPYLNLAVDYKRPVSQGFYNHQKSGIHNFSFSQWFKAPSNKYNLLSAYVFNQAKIQENGGVKVDDIFTNPAYAQDASTAPVNLTTAENKYNQQNFFFTQTFYFGPEQNSTDTTKKKSIQPKYGLTHHFEINANKIWYKDDEDSNSTFYSNFYISNDTTRDFTKSRTITNEIYFHNYSVSSEDSLNKNTFKYSWSGGLRYSLNQYEQNQLTDTRHGLQLFGSLRNNELFPSKFDYKLDAAVDLAPKYSGDFLTSVQLKFQPNSIFYIAPFAFINMQSPSMKIERFYTNHVQWKNDFKKQFIVHAGTKFGIPKWHLNAGLDYYMMKNYWYYGTNATPEQSSKSIQVVRVFAEKNFYLKNFVFKNIAYYQLVSNQEVIHQPKFYLKNQLYYRGSYIKKKPLHAQLGIDLTYFGNHEADAYDPAIMDYYVQNQQTLKFYPNVDAFFNLQVKRTRIFVVVQNITQGLFGEDGYYTHPNSPASPRAYRLGVSWQFYD
jgi:hypothetical protein